jgi:hypothetical protein
LPSKIKIFVKWSNFESLEDIDSKATTVAYWKDFLQMTSSTVSRHYRDAGIHEYVMLSEGNETNLRLVTIYSFIQITSIS